MRRPAPAPLTAALAAGLLAGCGITNPYQHPHPATTLSTTSTSSTASSAATATNPGEISEGQLPPTPVPDGRGVSPTPRVALARYAHLYINWRAGQLADRGRQLAAISTGQARHQAQTLANRGPVLARYQVTNRGSVTAIGAGQGAEQGRWVVVTNELTSGTGPYLGLPATSHVTWATVTTTHHGYVVSTWNPAS